MIQVKSTFNNGLFDCEEIYSDIGMKILEKTNGEKWKDQPIAIAVSRINDYVETSEPIDLIKENEQ